MYQSTELDNEKKYWTTEGGTKDKKYHTAHL